MTSAIVTGATGFVGMHLVQELQNSDIKVTALCRKSSQNILRLLSGVNAAYSLGALPTADVFYHLAWEGASGPGRSDAALQSRNVTLAIDALICAAKLGCRKFVILGTIYERFSNYVKKRKNFGSSDFYILSKDSAHDLTSQLAYKLGIDYAYVQICHPFGKYAKREQMFASVIHSLSDGKTIEFGEGYEYYDIVAVEDLAHGLQLIGNSENMHREFYLGSGNSKLLREYILDAKHLLGVDTHIEFGARPYDGLHFEREWFNINEAVEHVGYAPRISFEDMIRKYIKSETSNILGG